MSEEDDFSPAFAGSGSVLPNPYGTGFEDSIGQLEKTQNEWQKIEKSALNREDGPLIEGSLL